MITHKQATDTHGKTLSQVMANLLTYFVDNPSRRCVKNNVCFYSGDVFESDEIRGCLVGILLNPDVAKWADKDVDSGGSVASTMITGALDCGKEIPEIMLGHQGMFNRFQVLHDTANFWDADGFNKEGKTQLTTTILMNDELNMDDFKHILNA